MFSESTYIFNGYIKSKFTLWSHLIIKIGVKESGTNGKPMKNTF